MNFFGLDFFKFSATLCDYMVLFSPNLDQNDEDVCCVNVEVKYTKKTPVWNNWTKNRFGKYVLSSEILNNRPVYVKNGGQVQAAIWWSCNSWRIGPISKKGKCYGIRSYTDEFCVGNVGGYDWQYMNSKKAWVDAGEGLMVECNGKFLTFLFCKITVHYEHFWFQKWPFK